MLVDSEIRRLAKGHQNMVVPFREEQLNSHSYDVCLGSDIMIEQDYGYHVWENKSIADATEDYPFLLDCGQFILACTQEKFFLPYDVAATFYLKSSRGRQGYNHSLAGYCDAGWNNSVLTLELSNLLQRHSLPLWPGMRIGQMVFTKLDSHPEKSYSVHGHYNGDATVQPARMGL